MGHARVGSVLGLFGRDYVIRVGLLGLQWQSYLASAWGQLRPHQLSYLAGGEIPRRGERMREGQERNGNGEFLLGWGSFYDYIQKIYIMCYL